MQIKRVRVLGLDAELLKQLGQMHAISAICSIYKAAGLEDALVVFNDKDGDISTTTINKEEMLKLAEEIPTDADL